MSEPSARIAQRSPARGSIAIHPAGAFRLGGRRNIAVIKIEDKPERQIIDIFVAVISPPPPTSLSTTPLAVARMS